MSAKFVYFMAPRKGAPTKSALGTESAWRFVPPRRRGALYCNLYGCVQYTSTTAKRNTPTQHKSARPRCFGFIGVVCLHYFFFYLLPYRGNTDIRIATNTACCLSYTQHTQACLQTKNKQSSPTVDVACNSMPRYKRLRIKRKNER